jgi:hypothetical protein
MCIEHSRWLARRCAYFRRRFHRRIPASNMRSSLCAIVKAIPPVACESYSAVWRSLPFLFDSVFGSIQQQNYHVQHNQTTPRRRSHPIHPHFDSRTILHKTPHFDSRLILHKTCLRKIVKLLSTLSAPGARIPCTNQPASGPSYPFCSHQHRTLAKPSRSRHARCQQP